MKLFSPAVNRALIALLAIGAVAAIVLAMMPPRVPKAPLEGAQLAGTRGIRLEAEQPVPRFDDARAPIVVAPPAQGQWTALAARDGSRAALSIVVEPVDDMERIRVQAPLPIGRWDLVLEDDARQTRWPVRFSEIPKPSETIVRLKAEAEALDVKARPAFWASAAKAATIADRQVAAVERGRACIAAGDMAQATVAYQEAARLAGEMGEIGEQAGRLRAAAWTLYRQRRFEEALSALDAGRLVLGDDADMQALARLQFLRGSIQRETGLYRDAMMNLQAAQRGAKRSSDKRMATMVADELAALLSDLGQHDAALRLLDANPATGPERGPRLTNRAWMEAQSRQPDYERVRADLESAISVLNDPDAQNVALVNLIGLDLMESRLAKARAHLARLDSVPGAFAGNYADLARGELALRSGRTGDAQRLFDKVHAAAKANYEAELNWQSKYGLLRVSLADGDLARSATLAADALLALDRFSRSAAVSDARATWLADQRQLINTAVEVQLRLDNARQALAVLDGTRAWVLRDLDARLRTERLSTDARSAWYAAQARYREKRLRLDSKARDCHRAPADERARCTAQLHDLRDDVEAAFDALYAILDETAPAALADAELPRLARGEALLTAMKLPDRVVSFWLDHQTVEVGVSTVEDPLRPFAHRLGAIEHLYVVGAAGMTLREAARDALAGTETTWSELPFAGLLAQPQLEAQGPPVVIADPASDLRHARAEGRAVHARLGGNMLLGAQATRSAALEALRSGARVLHFAGHGALDAESPWQAHLVLANDERLTLADLLVARPILGIVVLSGCETGVRGALSSQHAVGLPDAFLLSGARAVIATDRVVPDADARAFVDHFYRHPDWATRPAAAFASAVRALRAANNPIWTAFRLMGRA